MRSLAAWRLFTVLAFGYAFLYGPIILLVVYSFNESKLVTVWSGFSVKWYGELLRNEKLLEAAWLSLKIAVVSATLATIAEKSESTASATRSSDSTSSAL